MNKQILVAVDFSDMTEFVLAAAKRMATAMDASIYLMHIARVEADFVGFDVGPVYIRDSIAKKLHDEHNRLQKIRASLAEEGLEVKAHCVEGDPADCILDKAKEIEPEMILLGSHGHGALSHLLAGSVCQGVMKKAMCPVVIVPHGMAKASEEKTEATAAAK